MTQVVGLTGGIASGKSLVAKTLRELGVPVVDADALARRVVAPGRPALARIVERFGPWVLRPDGELDRQALAARVFGDPGSRQELEAILHPEIEREFQLERNLQAARGTPVLVYDAALLVETGRHADLDLLVVVYCTPEQQIARLCARQGCSEAEARARIDAQLPLAEKLGLADLCLDNTGGPEETQTRTQQLWPRVLELLRARRDARTGAPARVGCPGTASGARSRDPG